MKTPLLCLLAFAAHSATAALVFTDNFNRPDTAGPNGGLGSNWDNTGNIFLNSNVAKTQTTGQSLAFYNGFDLSQTISLSVDIYSQSNGRYGGLVFNAQDSLNYYVFRASYSDSTTNTTAWQFLKYVNGVSTTLSSGSIATASMPLTTWRTFQLSGGTNGTYNFSITNLGGSTTYASGILTDSTFGVSGEAGFYFGDSNMWADNFSVTTVPEPTTWGLLGAAGALVFWLRRRQHA